MTILGGGKTWSAADHTSERTTPPWDDCGPTALVMLARAAGLNPPSTVQEAQALRAQAGYGTTGGTSYYGLRAAWRSRYDGDYALGQPADPVSVMPAGTAAGVIGSMGAFAYGSALRKWDPAFNGVHSVFVARLPDGSFLWDDPLAPEGIGYQGVKITASQLRAYYNGAGSSRQIASLPSGTYIPKEGPVAVKAATSEVPATVTVKAGTALFDLDGTTRLTAMSVDATKVSPYAAGTQRAIFATLPTVPKRLYLCAPATVAPIVDLSPYTLAQLTEAADKAAADALATYKGAMLENIRRMFGL